MIPRRGANTPQTTWCNAGSRNIYLEPSFKANAVPPVCGYALEPSADGNVFSEPAPTHKTRHHQKTVGGQCSSASRPQICETSSWTVVLKHMPAPNFKTLTWRRARAQQIADEHVERSFKASVSHSFARSRMWAHVPLPHFYFPEAHVTARANLNMGADTIGSIVVNLQYVGKYELPGTECG